MNSSQPTPKIPWTEARVKSFIISVLRAGSRRWPPKYETLNEAKTTKKKNKKTGRLAQHYRCNACNLDYPASDIQVDHIQPVVHPKEGFKDWNTFISRLYCPKDNFQVLCLDCHKKKTEKEKKQKNARTKNIRNS